MTQDKQATAPRGALGRFAHEALTSRHLPGIVAVLAVALALPALGVGWVMDDHYHRLAIRGSRNFAEFSHSPIDMFRFLDGNPERTRRGMDFGLLPWWTFPAVKAQFWRPLTVLTHGLDYRLWPEHPALMHAHSLLWFGGLVAAAAFFYRKVMGPVAVAGIAALLYAVDDARGFPVGWLANRNALQAAFFGTCALLAHDRSRRDGWHAGAVLGPLILVLSLLSAEAGIGTCAYLAAYALFVDRGAWRQRCLSLMPYAAVVVGWRTLWSHLGHGVSGMGPYVDPVAEPLRFAASTVERVPLLLLGQWALPPSEIASVLSNGGARILWLAACLFVAVLIAILGPLIRRDRTTRFWSLGMVLSLVPVCATVPADRLLFFVGLGAMGLLAQFLSAVFGQIPWRSDSLAWRVGARPLGYAFIAIHLVLAPIALSLRAGFPMGSKGFLEQLHVYAPLDDSVAQRDVVIVNAPSVIHACYMLIVRELEGRPVPRHTRILGPALPSVRISRPDAQTLVVRPESGYLAWVFDRLFRDERHPLSIGERVELTGLTVEVTDLTDDGRPAEASFQFAVPLEDPSLQWLQWKDGKFVPFAPPAVGRSVELRPAAPTL